MYRYIIIVLTFFLHLKASYAGELSSCVIQRSYNNSNSVRDLCSATIVDQSKIILDSKCIGVENPRSLINTNYRLSCANGSFNTGLPKRMPIGKRDGLNIFELKDDLPFLPTTHATNNENNSIDSCFVETHERKRSLRASHLRSDIEKIKFKKDLAAAGVYCQNKETKEKILMGVLDEEGQYQTIETLKNKHDLESNFEVKLAVSNYEDDSVSEICNSAYLCVSELVEDASHLNNQLDDILKRLSDEKTQQEREKLKLDFQELEARCHRSNIQQRVRYTESDDNSFSEVTMEYIEKGFIGAARAIESINPLDDEDFLLSQFKNTDSIVTNLSEAEVKATFERVNQLDLSNQEKIQELALAYSETIVDKVLDQMGTFDDAQEKTRFLRPYINDLKACLGKTINSSQVKECTAIFTNNIATAIGEEELDRQVGVNFTAQDNIPALKLKAKNEYLGCLDKGLGKFEKIIDSTTIVKGCVYKGIIASYQQTRRGRLNTAIKGYTRKEDNSEIISSILAKSNGCRYSPVLNKKEHNDIEYLTLAKMSTEDFTQEIGDCINALQLSATGDVVEIAVKTNKQINENLSAIEIDLLTNELKDIHLDACLKARDTSDGNECAKFITAMATLTAAQSILRNEFEKQFDSLNLPENQREKISERIIAKYELCAMNAREHFYKDLTKDPEEKFVNNCLTEAIKELSSNILEESITKSTTEKAIDPALVSRAVTSEKLNLIKRDIRKCFDSSLGSYNTMAEYQGKLNDEISNCTFNTQKTVIESIAQEMANDQIGIFGLTPQKKNEVKSLITNHINGSTPENMDERIDTLTPLLIRNVAPQAIETTLSNFKTSMTRDQYVENKDAIEEQLEECLNTADLENQKVQSFNATNAANECISVTTKDAFIKLAPTIVEASIASLFNGEEEKVKKLTERAKRNVMPCLERIKNDVEAKNKAEKCIVDELPNIASTIASQLLSDLDTFANKSGTRTPLTQTSSYRNFQACLTKPANPTLSQATENMNACIKDLEIGAKQELKKRFVDEYGRENPRHLEAVINIILQVPGEKQKSEYRDLDAKPGMANSELVSTLELLGETMKYSCENNTAVCAQHIVNTEVQLNKHTRRNPNATTAQNTQALIESDLMKNVIASQIGMTLNSTLKTQLADYNDSSNGLNLAIDKVTNNRLLTDILETSKGQELKEYILEKIDKGELDNLAEDTKLRSLLAKALTHDTGDGSFGDGLAGALVQTELTKMRKRASGLKGLFKEFKVKAGDLLNIIDRKDFKWDIITKTSSGKKAREYMIEQILAPSIAGQDLTKMSSTNKKYNNLQEEKLAKLSELITQALKEAND